MSKLIAFGTIAIALTLTACNTSSHPCEYNASANTLQCPEQTYKTVTVEGKVWMAENLNLFYTPEGDYCYDNDHNNCPKFGRLYQFDETAKPICPAGWKVPSKDEFLTTLKGNGIDAINASTGLNIIKAGFRYYDGKFADKGLSASFWTTDSFDDSRAYLIRVTDSTVTAEHYNRNISASIRCVKEN